MKLIFLHIFLVLFGILYPNLFSPFADVLHRINKCLVLDCIKGNGCLALGELCRYGHVDFEYHRFVFGVEYELGFVSITKGDGALRNGAFYATVGWKF